MQARFLAPLTLVLALLLGYPQQPALAACTLGRLAEIPITMQGRQPLLTAKINRAVVRLVLDTGSFWSFITQATASELKLRLDPAPANLIVRGVGGEVSPRLTTIVGFEVGGVRIPQPLDFLVGGTDAFGGNAGLLGQNILNTFDVEYDLANGVIRLWRPHDCHHSVLAYWVKPYHPYSFIDIDPATGPTRLRWEIIGPALVNGTRIRVQLDTGADTSFISQHAAARAGVKLTDPGVISGGLSLGLGRARTPTWIAPFASFKIGDEEIRHTRLLIGDLTGMDADMLLGADFFLSHRVFVANSQNRVYFTYNGGPVFDLRPRPASAASHGGGTTATTAPGSTAQPGSAAQGHPGSAAAASASQSQQAAGSAEPSDAPGFGRRGAAYLARGDFQHAIADLTHASRLDPAEPQYFYDRAQAHLGNRQPQLAMADLDQALRLKPDDLLALVTRAELRFNAHQQAAAVTDLDAASQAAPQEADIRFTLGQLYLRADLFAQAVTQYDLWLPTHKQDAREGTALYLRCRARALSGQDLDKALSDCNRGLYLLPDSERPGAFETRGLVQLRRGNFNRSLTDYSKALKLFPKDAWALYGRGLAEIHKGKNAAGQADLAAARALQPDIERRFREYGIAP